MSEVYRNLSLVNLSEIVNNELVIEEWLPIIGFEKLYKVSSFGRIKSPHKIKSQWVNKGYLYVDLWKENVSYNCKVHRLVAIHFIPNPNNKPDVNHLFGIKTDNRWHQLEWATKSENEKHAHRIGLKVSSFLGKKGSESCNSKPVNQFDLNGNFIKSFVSATDAEVQLNIKSVSDVCLKKRVSAGGFLWKLASDESELPVYVSQQKKVNQFSKNGVFIMQYESIAMAALCSGADRANISGSCRGKCPSAGGYKWEYATQVINAIKELI